ncbi:MAG: IPT/TIG domain-containing protein [Solirubrobacteraceae bacterium]
MAAALLSLGLGALSGNIGAAYASDPPPTVTTVEPNVGPATGGTRVRIRGANFTAATAVKFGATEATSFTVKTATLITARSPAGAGTEYVTVTTPQGTSATGPIDQFSYLPAVSAVSPISGPVGGKTTVAITGVGFTGATAVEFGSIEASAFTVDSPTSITAVSPAEAVGKVHVRVANPHGAGPTATRATFQFTPTVTSVSPNTGPEAGGTHVSVTGTGFAVGTAATDLKFGGAPGTSVNCTTTTECTVISPPHQAVATVHVTAIVDSIRSPQAPAAQFTYERPAGLYLRTREHSRLPAGASLEFEYEFYGPELETCYLRNAATIAVNDEPTDKIEVSSALLEVPQRCGRQVFGVLPEHFTLSLSSNGTASIAGRLGVRQYGCVFESESAAMSGTFEDHGEVSARLREAFVLTEEEPGAECPESQLITIGVDEILVEPLGSEHIYEPLEAEVVS